MELPLAQAESHFTAANSSLIILFAVFSIFSTAISSIDLSQIDFDRSFTIQTSGATPGNKNAMWLPLHHSTSTSSDLQLSRRHRLYERRPNAPMYLYDDLLQFGYYTTRLWIGTPPQMFQLITDSGSTVTYVDCAPCTKCGDHQDPKFQPALSSTYQPQKCNKDCRCDKKKEHCLYERHYAEMSSNGGILGEDLVSFGNLSELEPHRVVFGCADTETGDLHDQKADGIMGLGRGYLSIVDQLVGKGFISDSFSLCYGGMDFGGGAMVLGGISTPPDMVYTSMDAGRSPYYNVQLKEIHVAGKALNIDPKVLNHRNGAVLDSGTTYAYFPQEAFDPIKDAILKELDSLKLVDGPDPSFFDWCFSGAGSDISQLSKSFPVVEIVFGDGQKLSLSPENYLFRHAGVDGAYCLGIFPGGKDPQVLLGGIIVRDTLVTYDREKGRVGFWKTNCSDLWGRLQPFNAPLAVPSGSYDTNSSADMAPTLPPSESPEYNTSGKINVGQITFYMSLSINISDLEPRTSELMELIAKELDVNASQVHLVNMTSKVNESMIRWAIFPGESADYISNVTAMGIISRLAENSLHLPDTFGSCKVFDWTIEPSPRRTWLEQHYLHILVASIFTFIIGGAITVTWFISRKQQSVNSYKPVGSAGPDHELQPLQA